MGIKNWFYKKIGIKLKKNHTIDIKSQVIEKNYVVFGNVFVSDKNVNVGKYTYFNNGVHVYPNVCIGRYCSVANDVIIAPPEHQKYWLSTHPFQNKEEWGNNNIIEYSHTRKNTIIKNDVWIGTRAIIKSGVTIGNGAIIGAGAIVTKNIPDYAMVAGVPATIIDFRFNEDIIQKLLLLKWWELPVENLNNITFNKIEKAIEEISTIKSIYTEL